jgi:hypothetical protein
MEADALSALHMRSRLEQVNRLRPWPRGPHLGHFAATTKLPDNDKQQAQSAQRKGYLGLTGTALLVALALPMLPATLCRSSSARASTERLELGGGYAPVLASYASN